ncbi:SRPBCC family protein [Caulobacter sp. LjRoot300]|uniref:SRPBCC family protein n=1 Tax=Caulobacter sp. LjRoot300 TaxID=3342321 RepID=UPI003ECFF1A8
MSAKPFIILADETLSIAGPISNVFAFLSNHENYIRWYPGVVAVTSADGLPHGTVGKVYQETLRLPSGRNRVFDIKVVESRTPDLFMTEGTLAPLHPRMEMRLTAKSAHETVLSLKFFSRNQSAMGRFLIGALVRGVVRRQSLAGLRKLKSLLE